MTDVAITEGTKQHLINLADSNRQNAYCPYSEFSVGSAVFSNGMIYHGSNVEIGGRMGTVHAEMLAVYNAIVDGNDGIDAIATSTDDKEGEAMCSMCQHVVAEFSTDVLIVADTGDGYVEHSLEEELGEVFIPGDNR